TIDDPASFPAFLNPAPADRQLYTFLVDQVAQSVIRADADRAPAVAGWARVHLTGLTQNRSIEAHLADHGITGLSYGQGTPAMDPDGPNHTIDPDVDVLRVDKVRRGRRIPIGAWSNFADHGTVVHAELQAYSGDHHAAAWRMFVAKVRKAAHVPARQTVVNVYPNSDEGDQTAGIVHVGPAAAELVGDTEAGAMFRAWKRAGHHLSARPALSTRWTRACFCGQDTATGPVDTGGKEGAGFLTGSEEGRGPLFDITGVPLEGQKNPIVDPIQGDKFVIPAGNPPPAVPLSITRVGNRAIAAVPGEATKEVGVGIKAAVLQAMRSVGVKAVVIAGLANEYVQYITTPAEYGEQSYEGASTLYGVNEATFIEEQLGALATDLAAGRPAPDAYALDTGYGVDPDGPAYPAGASAASAITQPAASYARLEQATASWTGGALGNDRPVDRAFITAQRRVGKRWVGYADDLGLEFLWRSDADGHYSVRWEIPYSAPTGTYRLRVTAKQYAFNTTPFRVVPTTKLTVDGGRLKYPPAIVNEDLTARPVYAKGTTRDRYGNTASGTG
ncbi:MAG: neutral ceramidase, partial [Solirubrobacteraceae bacterium]|nr:neutral ceramidase [Solirubrobacteraceae bacterium]